MTHPVSERPLRPDLPFLLRSPAHFLALGLGSGLLHPAPGTWGTLMGIALYPLLVMGFMAIPGLNAGFFPALVLLVCLLAFLLGCRVAQRTGEALGVADHGSIVIDEIVAIWLVLLAVPQSWTGWLAAFLAFRFFDIVKPWPIRWLDARVKGGFGVMIDDIVAALFAIACLLLLQQFVPL
ncbi:phosphatidylglycerophosphatase A family protein [Chitinilyticum litopenaei]|uniref:phosphatidylglycerophosphatase A family protein n=1 Tax=Chitinilyticum litopenaei TaxID=1121276 RepID=UPI00048F0E64|nr:phosphatidylglycerophosphatase A [Chitinilyticum litopenaei]